MPRPILIRSCDQPCIYLCRSVFLLFFVTQLFCLPLPHYHVRFDVAWSVTETPSEENEQLNENLADKKENKDCTRSSVYSPLLNASLWSKDYSEQ